MQNTKYKKVAVSDRLPQTFGHYLTFTVNNQQGYSYFDDVVNQFRNDNPIKYWLEEVEDHEEEMSDMIKELISELDPATLSGNYQEAIDKAKSLLTKLKQQS